MKYGLSSTRIGISKKTYVDKSVYSPNPVMTIYNPETGKTKNMGIGASMRGALGRR